MEYRKSEFILDLNQPFGEVNEVNVHGGSPVSDGYMKDCGATHVIPNHGMTHGPSFADKSKPMPNIDPFAPVKR